MHNAWHIFQLGIKELISLARDPVLLFLIAYTFTFSVYTPSKSAVMDVVNASIAIVNEDDSAGRPRGARTPCCRRCSCRPHDIAFSDINRDMDAGRYTFVVEPAAEVPARPGARRQARRSRSSPTRPP